MCVWLRFTNIILSHIIIIILQCTEFEKAGAIVGMTPSDVIQASDITFSCVANPQAAKEVNNLYIILNKIIFIFYF